MILYKNKSILAQQSISFGCKIWSAYKKQKEWNPFWIPLSYLRLKNITLGYTVPQSILRHIFIQKIRVYGSVNNLCLLHNGCGKLPIDPEMNEGQGTLTYGTWGRTYPITRSWSVGIEVTF